MTLFEYEEGLKIAANDPSFYALIQAAMRKADSENLEMLKGCWPETLNELLKRYNAPGGILPEEKWKRKKRRNIKWK
jgi:hypothetical protein